VVNCKRTFYMEIAFIYLQHFFFIYNDGGNYSTTSNCYKEVTGMTGLDSFYTL
jgi:hypothetical protein